MNETHVNWGGKPFPITHTDGVMNFYEITVQDILDNYTALPINSVKGFASSIKCPVRRACAESVINETELTEYPLDHAICMEEPTKEFKQQNAKPYSPESSSDAALMATLLQGKDSKYRATLEEARKRGFSFTSKQLAVAMRKSRNLQED